MNRFSMRELLRKPLAAALSSRSMQIEDPNQPTVYDMIGGADKLREMVDRFYDLMDLEPEFAGIRALHPPSLDGSRDKTYWFLSGWSGGPNLYIERFGHPLRVGAAHGCRRTPA